MSTQLSQAQSAQQGNRTSDGKYTFGTHAEPDGLALSTPPAKSRAPLPNPAHMNQLRAQASLLSAAEAVQWANNSKHFFPNAVAFQRNPKSEDPTKPDIDYLDAQGKVIPVPKGFEDVKFYHDLDSPIGGAGGAWAADIENIDHPISFDHLQDRYEEALEKSAQGVRQGDAVLEPTEHTQVAAWTGEDGIQVVQIDHADGTPLRVNVNDGEVFEGDEENRDTRGYASLVSAASLRGSIERPPALPDGYDPDSVEVGFDQDGDARAVLPLHWHGGENATVWARDVAGELDVTSGGFDTEGLSDDEQEQINEHLKTVATNLYWAQQSVIGKLGKDEAFIQKAGDIARRGY